MKIQERLEEVAELVRHKHQPGQHDQGKHDPTKGAGGGSEESGTGAEPWAWSEDDYVDKHRYRYGRDVPDAEHKLRLEHKAVVESALYEGKPVPTHARPDWAVPFSEFQSRQWGDDELGLSMASQYEKSDRVEYAKVLDDARNAGKRVDMVIEDVRL